MAQEYVFVPHVKLVFSDLGDERNVSKDHKNASGKGYAQAGPRSEHHTSYMLPGSRKSLPETRHQNFRLKCLNQSNISKNSKRLRKSLRSLLNSICVSLYHVCIRFLIPFSVPYSHDLIIVFCIYKAQCPECGKCSRDNCDPVSYPHTGHDTAAA